MVRFAFVLASAIEGEGVALAAGTAVRCRNCREGVGETVVNDYRNLACAGHEATAAADASATPVGAFLRALVGALLGVVAVGVFRPRAMRLAAVPVTGGPAFTASAA